MPVVTLTVVWSSVPSGYVTVTGTSTTPGFVPSGKSPGLSTVTLPFEPSGTLTWSITSCSVVASPYGFSIGVVLGSYFSLSFVSIIVKFPFLIVIS